MKTLFAAFITSLIGFSAWGDTNPSTFEFGTGRLKPQDYLFAPNPEFHNDLFDGLRPVEAGVSLGIGADCGKINVEGTLKSTFGKVLNGDYFKGLAQDILGSAPMLAACYMSPTWCAILKHTQLSANFLTQTRLNQCQIIDKYTDARVEDYYRDRQSCVHQAIQANGGDMDAAMASCQGGLFDSKAGKWAGLTKDDPNRPSALIADSVSWAGFEGQEGDRVTELLRSMVGDTVIAQGVVKAEFGRRAHPYSPRSYLVSMEKDVQDAFCNKLIPGLASQSHFVNDSDIQGQINSLPTTGEEPEAPFLTPDLVRNLAYLPEPRRSRICIKLSQAMAMNAFTRDMNRSIDVLTAASQNPNLPPNRKAEIDEKRAQLQSQVEMTLRLRHEQARPLGEVMQYIDQEGLSAQDESVRQTLSQESISRSTSSHAQRMNDCADGVFCSPNGGRP